MATGFLLTSLRSGSATYTVFLAPTLCFRRNTPYRKILSFLSLLPSSIEEFYTLSSAGFPNSPTEILPIMASKKLVRPFVVTAYPRRPAFSEVDQSGLVYTIAESGRASLFRSKLSGVKLHQSTLIETIGLSPKSLCHL